MDKIHALLQKCNLSDEAAASICEAFEQHETNLREQLEEEFRTRTENAKRICLEEVEAHKAELSRRVQIFFEANSSRIEQMVARQAQGREGAAVAMLEQVKGLLEGVAISPDANATEVKRLRTENKKLAEDRDQAMRVARRQQTIAERVLKRNSHLEKQVALSEQDGNRGQNNTTVNENRNQNGSRRIDQTRQSGQSRTTRRTLTENQERHAPADNRGGNVRQQNSNNNVPTPSQIAASMPDE